MLYNEDVTLLQSKSQTVFGNKCSNLSPATRVVVNSGPAVDVTDLIDTSKITRVEKVGPEVNLGKHSYRFFKRLFDIVLCSFALILCAIPMLVIAILIKIDSPGSIFYRQERLGKDGAPFTLIKFRSMHIDAEINGAQWACTGDARITKLGRVLRKYRLDEIPQFYQVVSGKLSLIGPRPERKVFYDEFERYLPGFSQRLMVKPGISGLAQVSGGYALSPAEKIEFDIAYIKNRSMLFDLKIIFKTLIVLFTHVDTKIEEG